jgi:hypothetical protein
MNAIEQALKIISPILKKKRKAYQKAYQQSPKFKASQKAYYQKTKKGEVKK